MDPDIASWVLETFLREPLEDHFANSLLLALPEHSNSNKSVLLKILESDTQCHHISETTLSLLEQLEEVEFMKGNSVSDTMKRAYCAVAVQYTMKMSKNGDSGDNFNFFEAVKCIWSTRIGKMKRGVENGGLCSESLLSWKDDMEAAVWNDDVFKGLVKKSEEVDCVGAVNAYIREEREKMGPSFLELVAEGVKSDKGLQAIMNGDDVESDKGLQANMNADDVVKEAGKEPPRTASNACEEVYQGKIKLKEKLNGAASNACEVYQGKIKLREKLIGLGRSDQTTCQKHNSVDSAQYNRVRNDLKNSLLELRAVVKDPLPEALKFAEAISAELSTNKGQLPVDDIEDDGVIHASGSGVAEATHADISDVPRPSLMERNSSAHVYEWTEEQQTSRGETMNLKQRRSPRKWSTLEESFLRIGVEKYGEGNWKVIRTMYLDKFEGRTEVDLKDKWRNMMRFGK